MSSLRNLADLSTLAKGWKLAVEDIVERIDAEVQGFAMRTRISQANDTWTRS